MLILDTATRHGNGGEKVRLTLMKIRVDKKNLTTNLRWFALNSNAFHIVDAIYVDILLIPNYSLFAVYHF